MFETIKNFFRKRRIKKVASKTPTCMLSMDKITSANFLIDAAEPEFDQLKEDILTWCRKNNIKVNIYFLDLRRLNKNELVLTSIQTTILRKELDWLVATRIGIAKPQLVGFDLLLSPRVPLRYALAAHSNAPAKKQPPLS